MLIVLNILFVVHYYLFIMFNFLFVKIWYKHSNSNLIYMLGLIVISFSVLNFAYMWVMSWCYMHADLSYLLLAGALHWWADGPYNTL